MPYAFTCLSPLFIPLQPHHRFGWSVSVYHDQLLVGAPGATLAGHPTSSAATLRGMPIVSMGTQPYQHHT